MLLLSGISDTADGIIARRFNMITTLGKAIDPVADKLTQIAMLLCLLTRFPSLIILFALLLIKEITGGVMSLLILKRRKLVLPADWHGKLTTFLLYATMLLHLLWGSIPESVSNASIAVVLSGDADVVCALFYTEFPRAVPFGGQVRRGLR